MKRLERFLRGRIGIKTLSFDECEEVRLMGTVPAPAPLRRVTRAQWRKMNMPWNRGIVRSQISLRKAPSSAIATDSDQSNEAEQDTVQEHGQEE